MDRLHMGWEWIGVCLCLFTGSCAVDASGGDGVLEQHQELSTWQRRCPPQVDSGAPETTVDQSFSPPPLNLGASINDAFRFAAQTLTAGIDGALEAVSLEIQGDSPFPIHIAIQTLSAGLPSGHTLAEGDAAVGSTTLAEPITLSSPVRQRVGQQFAIVVNYPSAPAPSPGADQGTWVGATGNLYGGGSLAYSADGSSWEASSDADVFFQTYVVPHAHH